MNYRSPNNPIISVVINTCFGGFSLSQKAAEMVLQRKGIRYRLEKSGTRFYPYIGDGWDTVMDVCSRSDPDLIAVVRELGTEASDSSSQLKIVDFSIEVNIDDYDGKETAKIYGVEKYS